jgi:hypothetical protein
MGLSFRKRSGKIANGSKLIVGGQIPTGQKVFPNTFNLKSNPYNLTEEQRILLEEQRRIKPSPTPIPTSTPTPTPTNTPTPTPTPTPVDFLINPIITENGEYIIVGGNEYLKFN